MGQPLDVYKVRVQNYPIRGYNLEVLHELITTAESLNHDLELDLCLGVTPADKYYNDPQFTLILELTPRFNNPAVKKEDIKVEESGHEDFATLTYENSQGKKVSKNIKLVDEKASLKLTKQKTDPQIIHVTRNDDKKLNIDIVGVNQTIALDFVGGCPPACP